MTQNSNELLLNEAISIYETAKNHIKDLFIDLRIYNHKANGANLDENCEYTDSVNTNLDDLCQRNTTELEKDIELSIDEINANIKNFKFIVAELLKSPKSDSIITKLKNETEIKIADDTTNSINENVLSLLINDILTYLKTIHTNKFLKSVYTQLVELCDSLTTIFNEEQSAEHTIN